MAGSPCPIDVMRRVADRMGMKEITITYGLTEASPATTMTNTNDPLELRVSTVGRAMPFVETKIVDPETGKEVPDGVPGEFCSRGYTPRGYYKMRRPPVRSSTRTAGCIRATSPCATSTDIIASPAA